MNIPKQAIILFDGVCNFCNDWVNFIIEQDSKNHFKFTPLQSEIAEKLLEKHNINKETDSVILIEDGKAYTHSTAALRIARNLDGIWSVFYILLLVPKFIRDFFYKILAKYRYKLFGKKDECMIPTPEIRRKFL
ncbi:MAG: thiol-disulfide oxidoreductase DCC family protein [Acidobacteriota bacterium]|nr:thiol-disulfide oxidoreductase DCC family protein [Acidobacteriota bacterium]